MWLINACAALFLSVILYCGLSSLLEGMFDLSIESFDGILLFSLLYFGLYKVGAYVTKSY